jgi:hypothetical protein
VTWKRKSSISLRQPGDSERWQATADWVEAEQIAAVRPTKSQLKVGRMNFYPDKGTIHEDGQPAIRDRGLHAFEIAVQDWRKREMREYR